MSYRYFKGQAIRVVEHVIAVLPSRKWPGCVDFYLFAESFFWWGSSWRRWQVRLVKDVWLFVRIGTVFGKFKHAVIMNAPHKPYTNRLYREGRLVNWRWLDPYDYLRLLSLALGVVALLLVRTS